MDYNNQRSIHEQSEILIKLRTLSLICNFSFFTARTTSLSLSDVLLRAELVITHGVGPQTWHEHFRADSRSVPPSCWVQVKCGLALVRLQVVSAAAYMPVCTSCLLSSSFSYITLQRRPSIHQMVEWEKIKKGRERWEGSCHR